ncbi:MAG: UDP-N-acetylmuramoyl-L-alanyl-D-glutamate--2,6-diaminopimelate ligase [Candidatus Peribacteraceae bacterium]|nr:UDP-N-acetylmuramoyl-L-alanyl-D-glutamate--2,6-diaminopimelate ligase [Candidatus Peribacteraceae bacterium]MDD5074626.1 UDP-N-acetylmuramoyl-L-alanyl-D-glutamate--2,6-diaminopimelate ligase [Candidatus Peribacteraceae bacterium]
MRKLLSTLKKAVPQRHPLRLAWHHAKTFLAALINGFPARKLTIIAVTGTDGKTTTVGMTAHILVSAGIKTGALSTAFMQIKKKTEWNATQKTSPSPFLIQKFLRKLVARGCTHAVLEASSHGLVQGRLKYTWPSVAAVTNTTPEHLDYHGSMDQYRKDKGILFSLLRDDGTKVLNRDDGSYDLYDTLPPKKTLTTSLRQDADFGIAEVVETPNGVRGMLSCRERSTLLPLQLGILGSFNLENALCAVACARAVGVSVDQAAKALQSFSGVPGRLEKIDEGQEFSVYVDFTVTPAAYEKTLTTLRATLQPSRRLLVLTGSCGDRMREKRPLVGRICSKLADVVVVTNEDPYTEDPRKIIDEVWAGIDQSACKARMIFDRREAMRFLFATAEPGDAVILCAKGSDTTMMTAEGQIPWDERAIAREVLRQIQL